MLDQNGLLMLLKMIPIFDIVLLLATEDKARPEKVKNLLTSHERLELQKFRLPYGIQGSGSVRFKG